MSFRFVRAIPRVLALACAVAGSAQAQTPLETPAALSAKCLQTGPTDDLKLRAVQADVYAMVRVQLRFDSAEAGPQVDVLFSNGDETTTEQVRAHVSRYRLPCWQPSTGPVTFVQEFSLRGRSFPYLRETLPPEAATGMTSSREMAVRSTACRVSAPAPAPVLGNLPIDHTTNIVALLRFVAGRDEPEVNLKAITAPLSVQRVVERHIKQYRMACEGDAQPYRGHMMQPFKFIAEGGPQTGFINRSLSLSGWVKAIKSPDKGQPYFDFRTMACPFTVELRYMQPLLANEVKELGAPNANRQAFLNWIAGHTLAAPPLSQELLHASRTLVDVPCGVLDLR